MLTSAVSRLSRVALTRTFAFHPFSHVALPAPDPIFFVQDKFDSDPDPGKIILGVGAYRDAQGKPFVLPCVREAENRICGKYDHEYSTLAGDLTFCDVATKFAFGEKIYNEKKSIIATGQAISGSGSLRLMSQVLFSTKTTTECLFPQPTWDNQMAIFENAGLHSGRYAYINEKGTGLDFPAMLDDIVKAPKNTCFMFHACAHNPTGVDPTHDQWDELSEVCMKRQHVVMFDAAYLGYCSGDMDADSYSFRKFVEDGHNIGLCLSFSKNFGLYGERVGTCSFVCSNPSERDIVMEQIKVAARKLWSMPPLFGARIVTTILKDPSLYDMWKGDCSGMAQRIKDMRALLVENLKQCGTTKDWSHIVTQSGMFSYTGLTKDQVQRMAKEKHVYVLESGRASIASINLGNVKKIAEALHHVTK